jgi:DNA recombination protein RmuC
MDAVNSVIAVLAAIPLAYSVGFGVLATLLATCVVLLSVLLRRTTRGRPVAEELAPQLDVLGQGQERSERVMREELARNRTELGVQTKNLREEVGGSIRGVGETVEKRLDLVRGAIDERLRHIQTENEKKLEEMRATVDEKLQGTLEERLGQAFQQVSERLEKVHQGLGEMQTLAVGVGDLKKVLGNVKTRGTFGETQLEALLDQVLTPSQFQSQVQVKRGSQERVDFAVRLPGAEADGGEPVWLPIDAKFPVEDYARLVEAQHEGNVVAADNAAKALEQRIKNQAREIRNKYVSPPTTTDFAVMFLPSEGLYAEVLRRPGLAEWLQSDCKITIAGPTTLFALLNSLRLGFRTLAIQKRSAEVWQLLGAVKTQFARFGEVLERVDQKLDAASKELGKATARTRTIEKRLGKVEELPEAEAGLLLPGGEE